MNFHALKYLRASRRAFMAMGVAVAMICGGTSAMAKAPDFAFPKQVKQRSAKALEAALADGDGPKALRELINCCVADLAVEPDSVRPVAAMISKASRGMDNAAFRSMASLLEAKVVADAYSSNRYRYDQRTAPGATMSLWSGAQYRACIDSLVNEALASPGPLQRTPLSDYGDCLITDEWTATLYPTLFDFVTTQAADLTQSIAANSQGGRRRALELLKLRAEAAKPGTAARVDADLAVALATSDTRDFDDMMSLYNSAARSSGLWSGLILNAINAADAEQRSVLHEALTSYLSLYPTSPLAGCMENTLAGMEQASISVAAPQYVEPGKPARVKVALSNVGHGALYLYSIQAAPVDDRYTFNPAMPPVLVETAEVGRPGAALPWECDTIVELTFPKAGAYVVLPMYDTSATIGEKTSLSIIRATTLALAAGSVDNSTVWALDPRDGAPVEGAEVISYSQRQGVQQQGITSADGALQLKNTANYLNLYATKGENVSGEIYVPRSRSNNAGEQLRLEVMTAMPLCRPGDNMGWVAVAYIAATDGCRPATELPFTATLYDANGQPVDTLEVTTDRYGRATGTFAIPSSGGLNGDFRIQLSGRDSKGHPAGGSTYFTVSDYKLPTFAISSLEARQGVPTKGAVTIDGCAKAYSGYPIADAEVELTLACGRGLWWRRFSSSPEPIFSARATTGADGTFSFELPASVINNAPWPDGFFTVSVKVTSAANESSMSSTTFMRRPSYAISVDMPGAINADAAPAISLIIKAVKADGTSANGLTVNWIAKDAETGEEAGKGSLTTGSAGALNLKHLPSGAYRFTFTLADRPKDDEFGQTSTGTIVVYRPTDSASPVSEPLWTPVSAVEASAGGAATKVTVWAAWPTWVRYALSGDGVVKQEKWLQLPEGRSEISVALPADMPKATLTLSAMAHYETSVVTISVSDPALNPKLTIITESFRDHTRPGTSETWRFRLTDEPGNTPQEGAFALTLYNEALQSLRAMRWGLNPYPLSRAAYSWSYQNMPGQASSSQYQQVKYKDCINIPAPEFETYGYPLGGRHRLYIRGTKMSRAMTAGAAMTDNAVVEEITMESAKMAAPMDLAEEGEADAAADGGEKSEAEEQPFAYRDNEVALGLFRPMLETDSEGRLSVSFTMPDANTAWLLQAIAWTPAMRTARFDARVTASKPLMVEPGLPRFVRAGDRCRVEALVINADSVDCSGSGLIEVYSGYGSKLLASKPFKFALAAGAQRAEGIDIEVPATGAQMLLYRIKATAATFSDGEQAWLPVLPASQPVVETFPFRTAPGERRVTMTVPEEAAGADASTTLQVTANPAWEVITALPGLQTEGMLTAPQAARALFSACVADGIMRTNPVIAKTMRRWAELPEAQRDSSLTASLLRNPELRTLALEATPWVGAAMTDAERLNGLALLFDRRAIDAVRAKATERLAALRRQGGGWGWNSADDEPSEWATMQVATTLGRLNRLGYMPSDMPSLRSMTTGAVQWLDAQAAEAYRKRPGGNYMEYTWMRTMWPEVRQSSAARAVTSATVQQLTGRWADLSLPSKGVAAIILEEAGYHATAALIVESMREYAQESPEKGMWWPAVVSGEESCWSSTAAVGSTALMLEAFAAVEPAAPDIDRIRQWLIIQKQNMDWGSGADASAAVAAFVATSPRWLEPAVPPAIEIGGRPAELTPAMNVALGSGAVTIPLSHPVPGEEIVIAKSGDAADAPMSGAIYVRRTVDLASDTITAHAIPGLSIEKRLWLMQGGEATEMPAAGMPAGATVRVELTIVNDMAMDYVSISDERAACFEPVSQLPVTAFIDGLRMLRDNLDASTHIFLRRLPAGSWRITYDVTAANAGSFASGAATVQSGYNPALTARSGAAPVTVTGK